MSEDYPASSDGADGSDGGFDGLVDDEEEKEVMVQCGQRQVRGLCLLWLIWHVQLPWTPCLGLGCLSCLCWVVQVVAS